MKDPREIIADLQARHYQIKPNNRGGYRIIPPKTGRDAVLENQAMENSVGLRALLAKTMPTLPDRRPMQAATDTSSAGQKRNLIGQMINKANDWANNLMAPAAPGAPQFEPAEEAKALGRFLVPKSATGKAIALASLPFGGEGMLYKAASVGLPALVGAGTAAVTGEESPLAGGLSGAFSGVLGRVPELAGDVTNLTRTAWMRGRRISDLDNARMAETLGSIVDLPGIWKRLRELIPGTTKNAHTWADVFANSQSTKEAGAALEKVRVSIAQNLNMVGNQADQALNTDFIKKYGLPWSEAIKVGPEGVPLNKDIYQAGLEAKQASDFFKTMGNSFRAKLKAMRKYAAAAYTKGIDQADPLKPGDAAAKANELYKQTQKQVQELLNKGSQLSRQFNMGLPDFAQEFSRSQSQYAKFAASRDLADYALDANRYGHPMQKEVADLVRANPRNFQDRFGDQWEAVNYHALRRDAPDVGSKVGLPGVFGSYTDTDHPSLLSSMHFRAHPGGTMGGALFGSLKALAHPVGGYIGNTDIGNQGFQTMFKKIQPGMATKAISKLFSDQAAKIADTINLLKGNPDDATK
jgi:hypothetical protein